MSRHIALVIHALHGGGAERIAASMANQWAADGDRVTVITLDAATTDTYRVSSSVQRVGLSLMKTSAHPIEAMWNNRLRLRALRQTIQQLSPECVVSLTDKMNILTLLACRNLTIPVVIAEHSDPRQQYLGKVWEYLRRRTYPHAASLVVLTSSVANHLRSIVGDCPIYVIPGYVADPNVAPVVHGDDDLLIVAMGRLSREKGFDLLIEAFARIAARHPRWRLEIAGAGDQRDALAQSLEQHQLTEQVQLTGWVDDPNAFLKRGQIFVLASRYEGFPLSILEAMALGLAVVSFDCESGPREIVHDEVDGLLVKPADSVALAEAMERLMGDVALRQRLGSAARTIVSRFSPARFADQWQGVLRDVLDA